MQNNCSFIKVVFHSKSRTFQVRSHAFETACSRLLGSRDDTLRQIPRIAIISLWSPKVPLQQIPFKKVGTQAIEVLLLIDNFEPVQLNRVSKLWNS